MPEVPWIIKYRPKRIADVVDQEEAKNEFIAWLNRWLAGRPDKKAALLHGPPGCGKTSLVEATAKEYKLELIEMNASDFRRREDINRIAKVAATKSSLFGRKKIILLDEVDGISGTADRGALDAILELLEITKHPVVLTANDPWDPKLRTLRDQCKLIGFKRLPKRAIISVLKTICQRERLVCEYPALDYIAERAEGDLRSAINDLQAVAATTKRITLNIVKAVVYSRYREYNPFEMLRKLFTSKYLWQAKAALSSSNLDYDMIKQWIAENIPNQYSDPEELWRAFEALARADQYMGRIIKTQSWDLLAYAMDMEAAVAIAQKKPTYRFVKYSFPQKIMLLAKTREVREVRDALAKVIASHLHISSALAKSEVIPYLKVIFEANPRYAARLALGLNLTENMVKYLAGNRYRKVLDYLKRFRSGETLTSRTTIRRRTRSK